jgi:hypothetical protein
MKIFNKDGKINFIDDNNVFVGFDYKASCCETFGWALSRDFPTHAKEGCHGIDPDGFQFDTRYFYCDSKPDWYLDKGGIAVFKLKKEDEVIYLTLWNSHNGYYSHGFEMIDDELTVREGRL